MLFGLILALRYWHVVLLLCTSLSLKGIHICPLTLWRDFFITVSDS